MAGNCLEFKDDNKGCGGGDDDDACTFDGF
jgi:hypothetical protein